MLLSFLFVATACFTRSSFWGPFRSHCLCRIERRQSSLEIHQILMFVVDRLTHKQYVLAVKHAGTPPNRFISAGPCLANYLDTSAPPCLSPLCSLSIAAATVMKEIAIPWTCGVTFCPWFLDAEVQVMKDSRERGPSTAV